MKGPYERIKYDLRRLWECPVCQRRERAPGSITTRLCLCQMQKADGKPVVMKLIEDGVQRTVPPVVLVHEALTPLPPIVLPAYEPREPAAGQGSEHPIESLPLIPDPPPARGEGSTETWPRSEADPSLAADPSRPADPSPPAPLPQGERVASADAEPSPPIPLPPAESQ
jgi:hypothetical protein